MRYRILERYLLWVAIIIIGLHTACMHAYLQKLTKELNVHIVGAE